MLKIVENKPLAFDLWGLAADVPNEQYGMVGMQLMNEMWQRIKAASVRNAGTNHWVYLDKGRMFVGVKLLASDSAPTGFEHLQFELCRYVEQLHVGPYQLLPEVWQTLLTEIRSIGEAISGPSLEVYGHQSPDPLAIPETTILIGLSAK